jgi:EamA domain-containing membrane protein RarD
VVWLIFIWALQNDRMVEASLGYFINPLINVLFGTPQIITFACIWSALIIFSATSLYDQRRRASN